MTEKELKTVLNENQIEYLVNSNEKFNIKSCGISSGAHYMDMNFTLRKRFTDLDKKDGMCLIILPSIQVATNLQNSPGYALSVKGYQMIIYGDMYIIAAASGNPARLGKLLDSRLKYVYGYDIGSWSESVFNSIINSVEREDCIFDGVITDLTIGPWLSDFISNKKDLYIQDNFSMDNNKFMYSSVREEFESTFEKERLDGLKLKHLKAT